MPTTSPDNIFYADNTTPASLATITNTMANSVQTALSMREAQSFRWANDAAKSAQTGMVVGDIGYQEDDDTYYRYNGTAWVVWVRQNTAFTPTWSGASMSVTNAIYSVIAGQVFVAVEATVSSVTGSTTMTVPAGFPIHVYSYSTGFNSVGNGLGLIGANNYALSVHGATADTVALRRMDASATNLTYNSISSTSPGTWTTSSTISMNFVYPTSAV